MQIIKVLIPKAGLFPLDYKTSQEFNLKVGDLIIVPFRNRNITGIVWETNSPPSDKKLKIIDLTLNPADNNYKNIGLANIELIKKASSYYLASLGSIAKLVIPFDINLEVF
ncbi:MAG: primosomal protein N', partial [Alphaproteobacteria bacterium]|nr:primosomal protein N' [Alphaproteobacteria bacterium]